MEFARYTDGTAMQVMIRAKLLGIVDSRKAKTGLAGKTITDRALKPLSTPLRLDLAGVGVE